MAVIFQILTVIIICFVSWCLLVAFFGTILGVATVIICSPVFWGAMVGGLIAFWLGYSSTWELINGMIIGGGVVLLFGACELINSYKIIKLIVYTVLGVLVGLLIGIPIFTGIIAFLYGLYKS